MNKYVEILHKSLNGFSETIRARGESIYRSMAISITGTDTDGNVVYGISESQSYYGMVYNLELKIDLFNEHVVHSCSCPYQFSCKHAVALHLLLIHKIETGVISFEVNPAMYSLKLKDISENSLKNYTNTNLGREVENILSESTIKVENDKKGIFSFSISTPEGENVHVKFTNPAYSNEIITSCTCNDTINYLCKHKLAAFEILRSRYGVRAFFDNHGYTREKESLLSDIGIENIANPEELVEFSFDNDTNKIIAVITNDSLISRQSDLKLREALTQDDNSVSTTLFDLSKMNGYLFGLTKDSWTGKVLACITAIFGDKAKKRERFIGKPEITSTPQGSTIWNSVADDTDYLIASYLVELEDIPYNMIQIDKLRRYFYRLEKVAQALDDKRIFFTNSFGCDLSGNRIENVILSKDRIKASIRVTLKDGLYRIRSTFSVDKQRVSHNDLDYTLFIYISGSIYLWNSIGDYLAYSVFGKNGDMIIPESMWESVWATWFRAISSDVKIEFDNKILKQQIIRTANVKKSIYLKEMNDFMLIYPVVSYDAIDVHINGEGSYIYDKDKNIIKRDTKLERVFKKFVASTHKSFNENTFQDFFQIKADKVPENNWFMEFYRLCTDNGIEIFGAEKLQKIKYHPAYPVVDYEIISNNDWFDINVRISYDGLEIKISDLKKALLNKQKFVMLSDGRKGILPEKWLKKFVSAIHYGKIEKRKIRLRNNQFALVHELYDHISDSDIRRQLTERFKLFSDINRLENVSKPKTIKATLRDYQKEGLNWLAFLYDRQLGGCLADDMGLGKTLQMLSMFALANGKNRIGRTHLVVCPTSLIHNWNNEIEKFAPSMKTMIHWGTGRAKDSNEWKKYNIVITNYNILAKDISWIREFYFDIVVLDESQAIKNPFSLRYKAVCLLEARQRYVMTGTPIENSTIELYSQMHFLNPGLLGTLNNFKKQFSTTEETLDKKSINSLRRLLKPFIMRRTKEEVAKELPEKTEQVMYCEFGEEQRKIYDAFKNEIRDSLMHKVEKDGLSRSQFIVLDGLTKLRQICDSPSLLNTDVSYTDVSVKADELIRHIASKIRNHKALVFSQFLGMLSIIEKRLRNEGIKFIKLTGRTQNRQEVVEKFESDDECRVFLISLKTGGFGLNLVSADYVFLVDPWWNPAVEQQAIDRTHRIGQTKRVFAYRMIIRDSIEERILKMQHKKRELANDIIVQEKGFVKQLTKEDLQNLFT